MKPITKKRLSDQRAALLLAVDHMPAETSKHLLDIMSMLADLDSILEPKDKFNAAAELMVAIKFITAKQAKQHLELADHYR